jgi:hypothetical protein
MTATSRDNAEATKKPLHHPFLPTQAETIFLAIYPLTLLAGSLFSHLSITTRNVPYNATTQSHPAELAPSYFAQKRNIFNVYFVKIGWFWITLALTLFIFTHPAIGRPLRPFPSRRRLQAAARWVLATLCWSAVTQWFFGPPLIDRGFRFTGGKCRLPGPGGMSTTTRMKGESEMLTAAACKMAGGSWSGGLDISGHCFILILGSGLLWMEVLPNVLKTRGLRGARVVRGSDGTTRRIGVRAEAQPHAVDAAKTEDDEESTEEAVASFGIKVALGVAGLSWWMLLMTAAFFHTWFEKFTGLIVAFSAIWAIYFLPRGIPVLRGIVGMPAI